MIVSNCAHASYVRHAPSHAGQNILGELSSNLEKNDPDFGNYLTPAISPYSLSCPSLTNLLSVISYLSPHN